MIFVLYFPRGLAGFFIDQRDFVKSRSKLEVLYYYLRIIVPAMVTVLSVSWLVECFNTILHHQEKTDFILFCALNDLSSSRTSPDNFAYVSL